MSADISTSAPPAPAAKKTDPIIAFDGVGKWFRAIQVLKDVSFAVAEGSVLVLCGRSGSGKSTVLRCLCGLERPEAGSIRVMGRMLDAKCLADAAFRSHIGMVFQRFSLFPHMRVLSNLTLAPRKVRGMARAEAEAEACKMLARVGLSDKVDAYPGELSGGQQQRVAIARALVMRPKIMLFDEPTSALDPDMVREVLDVMRDLARTGMTMVVVTHEMGFAKQAGDRLLFMEEGAIIEDRPAADFFARPETEQARRFLENILYH